MRHLPNLSSFTRLWAVAASERRLHNRAKFLWQAACHGQRLPKPDAFDVRQMGEISEHSFLLELRTKEAPLVVRAGDVLCEEAKLDSVPISLAVIPTTSLLWQFGSRWMQALQARQPLTSEYEFTTEERYKVSCRGILLPMATDGDNIDYIYGVVNWKSQRLAGSGIDGFSASASQQDQ